MKLNFTNIYLAGEHKLIELMMEILNFWINHLFLENVISLIFKILVLVNTGMINFKMMRLFV